jgi:predicted  nucleic acid-binding Zn-ribbon protein
MHQDLRRLVRLQELMLRIEAIREKITAVPGEIARLEKTLLAAQAEIEKEKAALLEIQKERRRLEGELQGIEAKIQKYQAQLMDVKTNKEYQAMQHEIDGCRQERARLDEKILLDMEEQEKANAAAKVLEERQKEKRRETESGKKAIQDRASALEAEKSGLEGERQALEKAISPSFLEPFLKTAKPRKGIGLVPVRDGLCGGCHVRVMPKLIQEVRRYTQLIPCDSCRRFLYVPEDLAAPSADAGPGSPAPAGSGPDAGPGSGADSGPATPADSGSAAPA